MDFDFNYKNRYSVYFQILPFHYKQCGEPSEPGSVYRFHHRSGKRRKSIEPGVRPTCRSDRMATAGRPFLSVVLPYDIAQQNILKEISEAHAFL